MDRGVGTRSVSVAGFNVQRFEKFRVGLSHDFDTDCRAVLVEIGGKVF